MILKNNSASSRILSGSVASWLKILVGVGSQVLLVPIFLSSWDTTIYGVWLLLLAMLGALNLFALSFHDYIGFELIKVGHSRRKVSYLISASIPINLLVGLFIFGLSYFLYFFQIGIYLNLTQKQSHLLTTSLLISSFFLMLTTNISGFIERWLIPFGYYPFFAWLRVYRTILTSIAPAIVAFVGGDLIGATLSMVFADLVFHMIIYWILLKECRSEGFSFIKPRVRLGLKLWFKSTGLLVRYIIDMSRQMGARLVMAPIVAPQQIAEFATIRTGANIALQGVQSISSAILPELMRFIRDRDALKIESTFSIFWLMVLFLIIPSVLIIQPIMPIFFEFWTLGKIQYSNTLFAVLALGVLMFSIAMPFEAIIRGENLIKIQIFIASVNAVITMFGIFFFVPGYGIEAAGYSLLASEIISMGLYFYYLNKWMHNHKLSWPKPQFLVVLLGWILASLGTLAFTIFDNVLIIFSTLALLAPMFFFYWRILPNLIKTRLQEKLKEFS